MRKLYAVFLVVFGMVGNFAKAQFTLNGNASSLASNEFQLTPSVNYSKGSLFYNNLIDLSKNFEIVLDLNFDKELPTTQGGDGIAFILQAQGVNYLGNNGAGIGYHRFGGSPAGMPTDVPGPVPSLIVEFDTYENHAIYTQDIGDPAADHLGFMSMSNAYHTNSTALSAPFPFSADIEDGLYHEAAFSWNAATRTLQVVFLGKTYTYSADIINTIFGGNRFVYWGCTASNGSFYPSKHKCKVKKNECNIPPCPNINVSIASSVVPGGKPYTIYLGYGTNSATLTASASGGSAPYSFLWSNGATSQSITVTCDKPGVTNYTVVVRDSKGCSGSKTIQVKCVDVSCGGLNGNQNKDHKVVVCHVPPGNPDNRHEICVDYHAVPAHLAHGDYLGECDGSDRATGKNEASGKGIKINEDLPSASSDLSIQPNLTHGRFSVMLRNTSGKTDIAVSNASGSVVLRRSVNLSAKVQSLPFDLTGQPAGIYFVQIITFKGVQTQKVILQ